MEDIELNAYINQITNLVKTDGIHYMVALIVHHKYKNKYSCTSDDYARYRVNNRGYGWVNKIQPDMSTDNILEELNRDIQIVISLLEHNENLREFIYQFQDEKFYDMLMFELRDLFYRDYIWST